jgi:hypothetical protein
LGVGRTASTCFRQAASRPWSSRARAPRGGQIGPLTGVAREVEELEPAVLEVLDEFLRARPRAVAGDQGRRRPAALIRIVRVVPDEVANVDPAAAVEGWLQARTVEDVAGGQGRAGGIEERGGDVERGHRLVAGRAGGHDAGPADHERYPDAPLVDKSLAGP